MNNTSFFDLVKREFSYLEAEFGFQVVRQEHIGDHVCIEYRSRATFVRVLMMAPDFEPYFVVGLNDGCDHYGATTFDWVDVGALQCCKNWRWRHQENNAENRIRELSRLLRECGHNALRGKPEVFEKMRQNRAIGQLCNDREAADRIARESAELAWRARDYKRVVSSYAKLKNRLTTLEKRRLSYANGKKHQD